MAQKLKLKLLIVHLFSIVGMTFLVSCGEAFNEPSNLLSANQNIDEATKDKETGEPTDVDVIEPEDPTQKEFFDKKEEHVKHYGQFKDFPDPEFDMNQPLKIPTQEDLDIMFKYMRKNLDSLESEEGTPDLYKKNLFMNENGQIDFNKLLDKFRYKPIFKNVSFGREKVTFNKAAGVPGKKPVRYTNIFKNLILKNASFDNAKLEDSDFSGSTLSDIAVSKSSYDETVCMRCSFDNVKFVDSSSQDADFSFSSGNLIFDNNNSEYLKITDSKFDDLTFNRGTLKNSIFINSGKVNLNGITEFNNIFDDTDPKSLGLKSVGLVFRSPFPGGTAAKVLEKIRESKHQPIKIEYELEKFLDADAIQKEVTAILEKDSGSTDVSIAQKFVQLFRDDKNSYPQIAKLESLVKGYVDRLDALIIPGGLDVEPYFYDRSISAEDFLKTREKLKETKKIDPELFPIRTALEIFLLDFSIEKKIPLLMLCRGAHIYNIYKNGNMIPNIPDVYPKLDLNNAIRTVTEASNLSPKDKNHTIIKLLKNDGGSAVVYGNHHQAVDQNKPGSGLKTLLIWNFAGKDFLPYALYDRTYAPGAWLTQFHPEVKEEGGEEISTRLTNLNTAIYSSFFKLMSKRPDKEIPDETARPTRDAEPSEWPEGAQDIIPSYEGQWQVVWPVPYYYPVFVPVFFECYDCF